MNIRDESIGVPPLVLVSAVSLRRVMSTDKAVNGNRHIFKGCQLPAFNPLTVYKITLAPAGAVGLSYTIEAVGVWVPWVHRLASVM